MTQLSKNNLMKGIHSFKRNGKCEKHILSLKIDTNSLFDESSSLTGQDHLKSLLIIL
jgi:hypothetical protein